LKTVVTADDERFRAALERFERGIGKLKIVGRTGKEALIAAGHSSRVNAERERSHSLLLHFLLNVSGAFAVNINEQ
jgi:hypothetical protein